MSLTNKVGDLITGNRSRSFLSDNFDDVIFDSVIDFTENDVSEVSEHVIESGAEITDHVNAKPKTISFSAIITDDNIDLLDPSSFFEASIGDRFDILDVWLEDAETLTYYGHERDYENLQITDIARNKTLDTQNGWGVDISLKSISVVSSTITDISGGTGGPTQKGATGKGTTSKTGTPTEKKDASILKGAIGG
jgi:hypothetical protein